jgi:hypothetical protein
MKAYGNAVTGYAGGDIDPTTLPTTAAPTGHIATARRRTGLDWLKITVDEPTTHASQALPAVAPVEEAPRLRALRVDRNKIVQTYEQVGTIAGTAKALGYTWKTVRDHLRAAGVDTSSRSTPAAAAESTPAPARTPTPAPPRATARTRRSRPSNLDVARMAQLYASGQSVPKIAVQLGCGTRTVYERLKASGIKMRDDRTTNSGGRPRQVSDEVVARVRELYVDRRMSRAEVAAELGLGYKTVVTIMLRHNIPARKNQSGRSDGAFSLKQRITALGATSSSIRAWANEHGVDCPEVGVVPTRVVDAFEAARRAGVA